MKKGGSGNRFDERRGWNSLSVDRYTANPDGRPSPPNAGMQVEGASSRQAERQTGWNRLAAYWGIAGFLLLIGQALYRFYPVIVETVTGGRSFGHWTGVVLSVGLFGIGKGYFVLHRRFAPRFAARVSVLACQSTGVMDKILAPFFCLTLLGAEKRDLVRGYLLLFAIVLMILGAKQLPESWYGPVIVGVAVALAWGAAATAVKSLQGIAPED